MRRSTGPRGAGTVQPLTSNREHHSEAASSVLSSPPQPSCACHWVLKSHVGASSQGSLGFSQHLCCSDQSSVLWPVPSLEIHVIITHTAGNP